MEEAKITLKLLFKYIEEDRRKQCIKESEFMEKYELLQAQMDEYYVRQKEECISKQLVLNDTHSIEEYENEDNNKLKEELELYKEKCQKLEQTLSNKIQNKENMKPKTVKKVEIEEFPLTDDSINEEDDDIEKDPDWKRTPLYNRVQSLINTTRNLPFEDMSLKETLNGDIKCNCKTTCATRICKCRKRKAICGNNCKCTLEHCQNRDKKNLNRTLFVENIEEEREKCDELVKKPRLLD